MFITSLWKDTPDHDIQILSIYGLLKLQTMIGYISRDNKPALIAVLFHKARYHENYAFAILTELKIETKKKCSTYIYFSKRFWSKLKSNFVLLFTNKTKNIYLSFATFKIDH